MFGLSYYVHQLGARLRPGRPVPVTIAGEGFRVDNRCRLRGTPSDYDYAWLYALGKGKRCILDVGSNVGATALFFARHAAPGGVCVLFDPSLDALEMSARNLAHSGVLPRAAFAHMFVSDQDSGGACAGRYVAGAGTVDEALAKLRALPGDAPQCALDRFCEAHGLAPDLIKVDVEGAEGSVLRGMRETVRRHQPAVQVELHSFAPMTMRENARQTLDWCAEMGYRAWYLKEHAPLDDPEQVAGRGRCHVLLLPRDAAYPEYLRSIPQGIQQD